MDGVLDFIVIGARKAGTSSLFEHLRRHPELYLPPAKDHPFFSEDEIYAAGWAEFVSRNFTSVPKQARCGKVTHDYMYGSPRRRGRDGYAKSTHVPLERIIPDRIYERFPDIKLIAILRDPVERCVSDYAMSVLWGRWDRASFDWNIADLLDPDVLESSRRMDSPSVIAWGEYGRILAGYYAVFREDQIFVCFTDELSRSPHELMFNIFRFLEVDSSFVPSSILTRYREGALSPRFARVPSPDDVELRLSQQPWARSLWHQLPQTIRRAVLLRMRQLNYRYWLWNRRKRGARQLVASSETLVRLRDHYESDRPRLENLIGKPVPWRPGATATSSRRTDQLGRAGVQPRV